MFLKITFLLCLMVFGSLSISEKPSKIPGPSKILEGTLDFDSHNEVTNSSMIPEDLREKDGGMLLSKFFDKLSKKDGVLIYAHPSMSMPMPLPPPPFFRPHNSTEKGDSSEKDDENDEKKEKDDRHAKFFGFSFGTPFWGVGPYGWAGW